MKTKLQSVIQILLTISGLVLLGVSIFGRFQSKWPLCGALGFIIAANIMNILRIREKQKEEKNGSVKNR